MKNTIEQTSTTQKFFIKRNIRKRKTLQDFKSFIIHSGKTQKENISGNIDNILY